MGLHCLVPNWLWIRGCWTLNQYERMGAFWLYLDSGAQQGVVGFVATIGNAQCSTDCAASATFFQVPTPFTFSLHYDFHLQMGPHILGVSLPSFSELN